MGLIMNKQLIAVLIIIVVLLLAGYAWSKKESPIEQVQVAPTPYVSDEAYQPGVL